MNFIINKEEIEKQGLSVAEMFYMAALYYHEPINYNTFDSVCSKGFVSYDNLIDHKVPINPHLTEAGIEIVESVLINSEFKSDNVRSRFDILADKLRELFPTGRKPGTNYMWKDSTAVISKRLKALVKKYNAKFTDEEAIAATKRYVEGFNGNYMYMQLLKYFIFKDDVSQLLSYIQNPEEDINDNWVNELV